MDKQERKEILGKLKQQEKEKKVSLLPMSVQVLKKFFNFLNERLENGERGDSLKLTNEFCKNENLDFDKVKMWAAKFGGYDDAEIVWNCEQEYDFLIE